MISLLSCANCTLLLPPPLPNCPNCGGSLEKVDRSGEGSVLAATELLAPAAGWESPHHLVWASLEGGGTVLATAGAPLPLPGDQGRVVESADGRWTWSPSSTKPGLAPPVGTPK